MGGIIQRQHPRTLAPGKKGAAGIAAGGIFVEVTLKERIELPEQAPVVGDHRVDVGRAAHE